MAYFNWIDSINFLSKLSVRRLWNGIKVYSSYQLTKITVKSGLKNRCWKLWHANVITWDGLVVPCCFDKDAIHQLGNLKTQSFKETWHNDNYKQFRRELLAAEKILISAPIAVRDCVYGKISTALPCSFAVL